MKWKIIPKLPKIKDTKITIMLVPHSNKETKKFNTSFFILLFSGFLLGAVCCCLPFFIIKSDDIAQELELKTDLCASTTEKLELLLDEISILQQTSDRFNTALDGAIKSSYRGLKQEKIAKEVNLESFIYGDEEEDHTDEIYKIQELKDILTRSLDPIDSMAKTLLKQKEVLCDVPTAWPIENGDGRVTMQFGFCEHPFTKDYYLHKGLDIGYGRGKPIVAAANGVVIKKWYHRAYGNNLIIKHDLSYRTRYAHFDKIFVEEGDKVVQGQVIGLMGSTGLSTGPHLHFEVQIGDIVIDPEKFVDADNRKY